MDSSAGPLALSDTVGFVRDLPHDLVAAFRSTLSEARDADLLLHIVDAADPLRSERIAQVDAVLKEIGASEIPQLLVFNKIDRLEDTPARYDRFVEERPRVWISARDSLGLDLLADALGQMLGLERITGRIHLPTTAARLRGRLYELGAIRAERAEEDGWWLDLDLPQAEARRMAAGAGGHVLAPLIPPDVEPPLG
jgi:GTP-binding protein HflX